MGDNLLEHCLYFTANSLARIISRIGEEEFSAIGMTPSYAFLLKLAAESPGILQKELAEKLHMAPSTVSRFVDSLIAKGLLTKQMEGRNTYIFPTSAGEAMQPRIDEVWRNLYERYSRILGKQQGDALTALTSDAARKLQEKS